MTGPQQRDAEIAPVLRRNIRNDPTRVLAVTDTTKLYAHGQVAARTQPLLDESPRGQCFFSFLGTARTQLGCVHCGETYMRRHDLTDPDRGAHLDRVAVDHPQDLSRDRAGYDGREI